MSDRFAIDGKSLRGTHLVESHRIHLLAAVSHELGIPLAECAVGEKTNEIPVSTQLLKHFDVAGKVITTDALLTQRAFCKELLAADADYALPVKANQKQVLEDIRDLFKPLSETDPPEVDARRFENLHTQAEAPLDTYTDVETAHGFITTRTLRTRLTPDSDWPGLAQVYEYRIATTAYPDGGNHTSDAVWHHKSPREGFCSRLAQTPTRACD